VSESNKPLAMEMGTLIFLCGKMGAGKSTQSKVIATEYNAVLLSEDERLFSLDDYHF